MRTRRKPLRKKQQLSTALPTKLNFIQWLNRALQDERWQTVLHDRLKQTREAEIRF
jgi:hypothetical protein